MKIKLFLLALILSLGLLCPGCTPAETPGETTPPESPAPTETLPPQEDGGPTLSKTLPVGITELTEPTYAHQNVDLTDGERPASALAFSLSAGQPYAKMWVMNSGSNTLELEVYYNDTANRFGETVTLAPGKETVLYVWANENYGDYTLVVSTRNGSPVAGSATVLTGK